MYWHGRLVIPALQRFCASQQVALEDIFPLVLLQTKVVGIFQEAKTKHVKLSKLISRIIPL
jgi:hypothetical protein